MFGHKAFATPKPVRLIQRIVQLATGPEDLVLDAFAGSGTTGHAVLAQNALDGGNRRFVLVEMDETIARTVTAERVRRAAEGYAFTGTARTELLRKPLTLTALRRMPETLAEAARLREGFADRFDRFEEKADKGAYALYGVSDVAEMKAGLGGSFRYARLGPPLVDGENRLAAGVTRDDVARFVFFAATGTPLVAAPAGGALVGVHGALAVYLLGTNGDGVLTGRTLAALPAHDGPRVVFGTASRVAAPDLRAAGVEFRQIPYALPC